MRKRSVLFALCMAAVSIAILPAHAQNLIDSSSSIGDVPDYPGTGLWGLYYDNEAGFSSAQGSPAEATFTTTNVCFPDCLGGAIYDDSTTGLALFTNGNATNIMFSAIEQPRMSWNNSELDMAGYIAITQAGVYNFTLNSDDGSSLTIGNGPTQGSQSDLFSAPGLYPISLQFFENGGGSLLKLTGTDPNGSCILGCYDGSSILPNDLFYSESDLQGAPAPAIGGGWSGIAAVALLGIGLALRRAKQVA